MVALSTLDIGGIQTISVKMSSSIAGGSYFSNDDGLWGASNGTVDGKMVAVALAVDGVWKQ